MDDRPECQLIEIQNDIQRLLANYSPTKKWLILSLESKLIKRVLSIGGPVEFKLKIRLAKEICSIGKDINPYQDWFYLLIRSQKNHFYKFKVVDGKIIMSTTHNDTFNLIRSLSPDSTYITTIVDLLIPGFFFVLSKDGPIVNIFSMVIIK